MFNLPLCQNKFFLTLDSLIFPFIHNGRESTILFLSDLCCLHSNPLLPHRKQKPYSSSSLSFSPLAPISPSKWPFFPILFKLKLFILFGLQWTPRSHFYFMPWVYCQIPQENLLHWASHHSHQLTVPWLLQSHILLTLLVWRLPVMRSNDFA